MNYSKHYLNLILKAKDRSSLCGENVEMHHSVPKHWFLEGKKKSDYDFSLVALTRREHFIAHRLLSKMFPNNVKAKMALLRMINTKSKKDKYHVNCNLYKSSKEEFVKLIKEIRSNETLDHKRRKAASQHLKRMWQEHPDVMIQRIIKMRNDPKDKKRRNICSLLLKDKNKNGLAEKTKKRNKNLNHMTVEQKNNFKEKCSIYKKSDNGIKHMAKLKKLNREYIAVIDNNGINHYIHRDEYNLNKGIKFHHVNTKQAKLIRQKFGR